jgi:hypothetical protein
MQRKYAFYNGFHVFEKGIALVYLVCINILSNHFNGHLCSICKLL